MEGGVEKFAKASLVSDDVICETCSQTNEFSFSIFGQFVAEQHISSRLASLSRTLLSVVLPPPLPLVVVTIKQNGYRYVESTHLKFVSLPTHATQVLLMAAALACHRACF